MSSLTERAPIDPADRSWIKVDPDVLDEVVGILIMAQTHIEDPGVIREIAYGRRLLQLAKARCCSTSLAAE